jgi:hypothetical protein
MTTTIKYAMVLGIAALMAQSAQAAMVDFHFGADTQTGAAALGNTGDFWNASNNTNGGPTLLSDVTGQATGISLTWTSSDPWAVTSTVPAYTPGTPMDAATTPLMRSYASSYSYHTGPTNLKVSLTGLAHSQAYTMVIYGAGNVKGEGATFTVAGASTYTGTTNPVDRRVSGGEGDTYTTIKVVSSPTGTLNITAVKSNYPYTVMNGFQLIAGTTTASTTTTSSASTPTPVTPVAPVPVSLAAPSANSIAPTAKALVAATVSTGSAPSATATTTTTSTATTTTTTPSTSSTTPKMVWGICGHPDWSDYASWVPANVDTQVSDIKQLGASYYRVSFEGAYYPAFLDKLVPKAQAAGVTLLPDIHLIFTPSASAQSNYSANYTTGYTWAAYAIAHGYKLPYWELSNEVENSGLLNVIGDGSSPANFTDAVNGGFVAIASGLDGAYDGVKDAYAAGRTAGTTTITPQVMIGMCYRHWGLLAKIQAYNDGVLPCDLISWHWYGPTYGDFNTPVNAPGSFDNGRTPAACLADFKSKTDPTKPMDVWMTETNRSLQIATGVFLNGSTASNSAPSTSQDWASEATAIQNNIESFKKASNVKAVFVYELYDETKADNASVSLLANQGYFGIITGLNGTKKNAFYTYQAEIKASN